MRTHKNLIDRGEVKETFFLFCWMQSTWQLTWPAEEDISIFILKNICFLVDHWKDESASGKLHKGNDIYISNVFCKLITRLYICLVTSLPLWGRTTSFLRHLTFFGQLINPCRKIWAVCHLRVAMKLGQCWVELHYGIVLGTLSLLLLTVGNLRRNWVKMLHKTVPQCNSTQHGPRPRPHVFDYVWKRRFFPLRLQKKNTRAQVAYSPVHTKTLKGNSLTYISFTLFYSASKSATLFVRSHKQFDTFCTVRHRIISALWRGQTILDQQYRKAAISDKVGSFSFSDKKWREFHIKAFFEVWCLKNPSCSFRCFVEMHQK